MRVFITGGSGLIGKALISHLIAHNDKVRSFDSAAAEPIAGVESVVGDILDMDAVQEQMQGCDVVVHLAAHRSPTLAPAPDVFRVNAAGTFNVFESASRLGIKRVVQASSINAVGGFYSTGQIFPQYLPLDEDHPSLTTDPYSFSKEVIEDIGAYYWRRDGISSVALRFPAVFTEVYTNGEAYQQRRSTIRAMLDELVAKPETEQRAFIADLEARVIAFRQQRPLEFGATMPESEIHEHWRDLWFWTYCADRFNFWAVVDVRDAARSLALGLTAEYTGAHPLYINSADNWLDYDTPTLLRLFYPDVQHFKKPLSGSEALVNIDKARELLGFEPVYLRQPPI